MITLATLREILELVFFVSAGPILAIIAGIGLRQISVLRKNAQIDAQRAALSLAAERCEHYHRVLSPLQDKLNDAIKANQVTCFATAEVEIKTDSVRVESKVTGKERYEQITKIGPELISVLNAMDAFSIYFTTGAANEQVAFSSVGVAFVDATRDVLPAFVHSLEKGHYRHLMKLFFLWNNRIAAEQLHIQKEEIEAQLTSVGNKFVKPFGT
jgi:hypothetical protein